MPAPEVVKLTTSSSPEAGSVSETGSLTVAPEHASGSYSLGSLINFGFGEIPGAVRSVTPDPATSFALDEGSGEWEEVDAGEEALDFENISVEIPGMPTILELFAQLLSDGRW